MWRTVYSHLQFLAGVELGFPLVILRYFLHSLQFLAGFAKNMVVCFSLGLTIIGLSLGFQAIPRQNHARQSVTLQGIYHETHYTVTIERLNPSGKVL